MLNLPAEIMPNILLSLDQKEIIKLTLVSKSLYDYFLRLFQRGFLIFLIRNELIKMFDTRINFDALYDRKNIVLPAIADQLYLYKQIYYVKKGELFSDISDGLEILLGEKILMLEAAFFYAQLISRCFRDCLDVSFEKKIRKAIVYSCFFYAESSDNLTFITLISLYLKFFRERFGYAINLKNLSDLQVKEKIDEISGEMNLFLNLIQVNNKNIIEEISISRFKEFVSHLSVEYIDRSLIDENTQDFLVFPGWVLDVLSPNLLDFLQLIKKYNSSVLINDNIIEKILPCTFKSSIRWIHEIYKENLLAQFIDLERSQTFSLFELNYYCLEFLNYQFIKKLLLKFKNSISLANLYNHFINKYMSHILDNAAFKGLFCYKFLGEFLDSNPKYYDKNATDYFAKDDQNYLLVRNIITLGFISNTNSFNSLQEIAFRIFKLAQIFDIYAIFYSFLHVDSLEVGLNKIDEVYEISKPFSFFRVMSENNVRKLFIYHTSLIPMIGKYIFNCNLTSQQSEIIVNEYVRVFYVLVDNVAVLFPEAPQEYLLKLISFILTNYGLVQTDKDLITNANKNFMSVRVSSKRYLSQQSYFFKSGNIENGNHNTINNNQSNHADFDSLSSNEQSHMQDLFK